MGPCVAAVEGEAACAEMVLAAQRVIEAVRKLPPSDAGATDAALVDRVQALHAEYEVQWERMRDAAQRVDQQPATASDPDPETKDASDDVAALREERSRLKRALDARNRALKDQIDQLRQTLCAVELMHEGV